MVFPVTILLCVSTVCSAVRHGRTTSMTYDGTSTTLTYDAFRREIGIERDGGDTISYEARKALFEEYKKEVQEHNARPDKLYTAAVNKFADFSTAEFEALLGHRPGDRRSTATPASMLDLQEANSVEVAASVDLRRKLNKTFEKPKSQGHCGSCWAVAAASAIEIAADIRGKGEEVSYEQLVDCVKNPRECGGQGGCKGATPELAFAYVKAHGICKKSDYNGYQSGGDGTCRPCTNPALVITGFKKLQTNKMMPLLLAVSKGPVAVSAHASPWHHYKKGVFDGCKRDAVTNHAIVMMGYGTKKGKKKTPYWLIRNSWGRDWGEDGYINLLRHTEENSYCGTDYEPLKGTGCKGGPATVPVCGMCGILSDSSHPVIVTQV